MGWIEFELSWGGEFVEETELGVLDFFGGCFTGKVGRGLVGVGDYVFVLFEGGSREGFRVGFGLRGFGEFHNLTILLISLIDQNKLVIFEYY